jgi:hypothetical protein
MTQAERRPNDGPDEELSAPPDASPSSVVDRALATSAEARIGDRSAELTRFARDPGRYGPTTYWSIARGDQRGRHLLELNEILHHNEVENIKWSTRRTGHRSVVAIVAMWFALLAAVAGSVLLVADALTHLSNAGLLARIGFTLTVAGGGIGTTCAIGAARRLARKKTNARHSTKRR